MANPKWSIRHSVLLAAFGLFLVFGFDRFGSSIPIDSVESDYPRIVATLWLAQVERIEGPRIDHHELAVYTNNNERFYIVRSARSDAARFLKELRKGDELTIHHRAERHRNRGHEIVSMKGPRGDILSFEKTIADQKDINYLSDFFGWMAVIVALVVPLFSLKDRILGSNAT